MSVMKKNIDQLLEMSRCYKDKIPRNDVQPNTVESELTCTHRYYSIQYILNFFAGCEKFLFAIGAGCW